MSFRFQPLLLWLLVLLVSVTAGPLAAEEKLTAQAVVDPQGDGPDGKGNTADDTWQFWLQISHDHSKFIPFSTATKAMPPGQRANGIPRRVHGPIGSMLPNAGKNEGWIYHRDWDGRFEGVWGNVESGEVLAYPYVEKRDHLAVAITYKPREPGTFQTSGKIIDAMVQPQFKPHDGIDWRLEVVAGDKVDTVLAQGGPIGDGHGRPDSAAFAVLKFELKAGQRLRLVIDPRKWWGSDLTQIENWTVVKLEE